MAPLGRLTDNGPSTVLLSTLFNVGRTTSVDLPASHGQNVKGWVGAGFPRPCCLFWTLSGDLSRHYRKVSTSLEARLACSVLYVGTELVGHYQEPKQFQAELRLAWEHPLAAPVRCASSRHCQGLVSDTPSDQLADCADRLLQIPNDGSRLLQTTVNDDEASRRELKCPKKMFVSEKRSPRVALRGAASVPLLYQPENQEQCLACSDQSPRPTMSCAFFDGRTRTTRH